MTRLTCLLGLLALLTIAPGEAHAKSYRSDLYTTQIQLLDDGSMIVTEEFVFRFRGGPFTRAHRDLRHAKSDGIDGIQSPDPIRIRQRSRETRIRWTYAALRDTTRTFSLTYRIQGALRVEGGRKVLRWHLFPTEREYAIDRARAVLILPEGWSPPEEITTRPGGYEARGGGSRYLYEFGPLKKDRSIVLNVVLPGAATAADVPLWQREEIRYRDRAPMVLAIAGALLLACVFAVLQIRRGVIADLVPPGTMPIVTTPPSDLAPAMAGGLRDGQVTANHALATLLDLARRNILRFESDGRRSVLGRQDAKISLVAPSHQLARWEAIIVETVFRKRDPQTPIPLRKAWERIVGNLKAFSRALEADLEGRGDFDPQMRAARSRFHRMAVVFGALGLVAIGLVLAVGYDSLGPASFAFVAALGIAAVVAVIVGGTLPLYSAQGRQRSASWRAFAIHIKESAKGVSPVDTARFEGWLPYAAAFGLLTSWFKAGKKWSLTPPSYLHSIGDGGVDMAIWAAVFSSTSTSGGTGAGAGGAGGGGGSGAS